MRILLLLIFLNPLIYACTLCSAYSPKTHVSMEVEANKSHFTKVKVKWLFADEFTDELYKLYDLNLDTNFDKKELSLIKEALLDYIIERNYLFFISYGKNISEYTKKINVKESELKFNNKQLSFHFEFDLNYKIVYDHELYLEVYDEEAYFIMIMNEQEQKVSFPFKVKKSFDSNSATYKVIDESYKRVGFKQKTEQKQENIRKKNLIEDSLEEKQKQENSVDIYVQKIKTYLLKIEKEKDMMALVLLLFASFIYGLIHALGPGHGKALAFSYFSAQKSSYMQALAISMASAFIHIVGALVLVIISIFIIQSVFSSFLDDSITYITKTSAVLIMLLSVFILYRKIKKKECACCAHTEVTPSSSFSSTSFTAPVNNTLKPVKMQKMQTFLDPKERKKQDLYFVLTSGIIPCPGTIVLFVYAFILKTYVSVFLAALFISLGMGLVIFASSFLGLSLNKLSSNSSKLKNILEILAPIFMFILGMLLFLNANLF